MPRDDFSLTTKNVLAHRVGMKCSNPGCRQPTSGPTVDPLKAVNVGVAAHIAAASVGGPRYDPSLTNTERKSVHNGIWLCQKCAKLVDNDTRRYTSDVLRDWKRRSEEAARLEIEQHQTPRSKPYLDDVNLIRFYAQCFDRSAFQEPFRQEGSTEHFDDAIRDTLTAINTGTLRDRRDGAILGQAWGKSFLINPHWRETMDRIADLLKVIRFRYQEAKSTGVIEINRHKDGTEYHCVHDHRVSDWMDSTRSQVLELFSAICKEAGVHPPKPRFGRAKAQP